MFVPIDALFQTVLLMYCPVGYELGQTTKQVFTPLPYASLV